MLLTCACQTMPASVMAGLFRTKQFQRYLLLPHCNIGSWIVFNYVDDQHQHVLIGTDDSLSTLDLLTGSQEGVALLSNVRPVIQRCSA